MRVNLLLLFFILLTLGGCGATTEEEVEDAIVTANQYLSKQQCDEALRVLEGVGAQPTNPDWLSAYASAQACKAPWNVVRFFETDLDSLDTTSESTVIGSLAKFSQANMTSATDGAYTNLRNAIDTLLYAGGISTVSYGARVLALGSSATNNLATQTLYMQLSQIGKFARFFGNADSSTGVKGSGAQAGVGCYINYTDNEANGAQAYLTAVGALGTCNTFNEGHPDLTGNRELMCEGIVLFNNFIDVVGNITIDPTGNNGNLGDLDSLSTNLEALCADATTTYSVDFGGTCTVKTKSTCVNNADNRYDLKHLERYFALIWEGLHQ